MDKIIQVTQKPVIEYSIIESASIAVDEKIKSLSLDTLEVTENSLTSVKKTRAELSNDFKVFEEQRKLVKDIILKPYNEFEEKYKEMIASKFKDADLLLKTKIDEVSDAVLNKKIDGIKEYFESTNEFDFVKFEDLGLKIIKSVSDKKLCEEIDIYLSNIKTALETIETLPNKDRVLVKFQMSKDLNNAISQTNIEIQREQELESQRQEQEKRRLAYEEEQRQLREQQSTHQEAVEGKEEVIEQTQQDQIFKSSFTVFGTKEQLKALKEFLVNNNIQYEGK